MTSLPFALAGGLAATWLLIHLIWGGRDIARPLVRATSLDPVVRHTQYLCWHFTSVAIGCMAIFFGWAALSGPIAMATAGTLLALGFFCVGVGLVAALRESHARLPQGWLFLPVAALGLWGHLA
ncbi:hypothetical protein [Primorskyibacter sp. S187A]|uniref:hypothetical protein n=1 Tax=Primorskyibacter sp. S187A TaxID=3415130 RepID=UPI003C7DBBCD